MHTHKPQRAFQIWTRQASSIKMSAIFEFTHAEETTDSPSVHVGDVKYLVALHVTIGIIITLGIIITMGIITMCTPKNQLNVNFMSDLDIP